jgi:tetratricopeptide (TPR) repeat protein
VPTKAMPPTKAAKPQSRLNSRAPVTPAALDDQKVHEAAVEMFERAFRALQQRQFGRAAELLKAIIKTYPEEKELQERVRVYLTLCERQASSKEPAPKTFEDRVYAATVAINRGAYDEGLTLLRRLEAEDGSNDHVHYMLSVVHALKGDIAAGLGHLRQAIDLNPENRYLASQDVDFEPLHEMESFVALLEAPVVRRRRR